MYEVLDRTSYPVIIIIIRLLVFGKFIKTARILVPSHSVNKVYGVGLEFLVNTMRKYSNHFLSCSILFVSLTRWLLVGGLLVGY